MEARKILFVMNNSSSQKSIMSEAETLGALKADMRRAGINYDNMTFYEGRTRTELKDDASVLPTNVPVAAKGTTPATTTNDLVFMLTTANKKIRSGAGDRPAAYAKIKQLGLQDACKAKYGKNFTQCSTSDLEALIAGASPKVEPKVEAPAVKAAPTIGNTAVIISNAGSAKPRVMKVVMETVNVSLKEARAIVEGVPSRIQGLTKEVAAKFVSDLIGAGAMASIEGQGGAPSSVAPIQVIDVKARRILGQLLNLLIDEEDLYGNYSELLDDLQGECGETQAVETKAEQPAPKKEDDNLSQSEINSLFGGWAR
jgi:large subunit ribosomal protein L7/L12|nr:MAG TPA: ribosomal protein L7/L12 [Crassvirales sp.]